MDNLPGTSGNDIFTGGTAEIQAADVINGQSGDDTARLFLDTGNGTLQSSNVETFEIQSTGAARTFTANNVTGMTKVINERSATDLKMTSLQNMVDLEINSPTGAANVSDTFLVFASGVLGGADQTLDVKVNNQTTLQELDVDTAGGDTITTMNLESTGGKNAVELNSTTAGDFELKTLNVSGDTRMTLTDSAGGNTPLSSVTTVNASTMTAGGLRVDLTNNTKDVTFTGGAGDDRVIFAAGNLDSNDVIDMGDGTKDAIIAGEGVFTASGANWVKAINNAKNVEIAGSSDAAGAAGAAGNAGTAAVTVDMSVFSSITSFETTAAAVGGAGTAATANAAGLAGGEAVLGTFTVNNTLYIDDALTGGAGSAAFATGSAANAGGAGGDAIAANMKTDTGSDVLNLVFQEDAPTAVTGGAGGAGVNSGVVGAGGLALDAQQIETINITTTSSKDDLTFRAGVDGAAAATTTGDVRVGTNGKIDIAGAGDVDLGVVISSAANPNNNLTVDGADMSGKLTVTVAGTNDTVIAGTGGSAITLSAAYDGATNQVHSITFGSGSDQLNLGTGTTGTQATASTLTSFTSGIDKVAWNGPGTATFNANKVDVSGAANLAGAIDLAAASTTAGANGVVRYFNWEGNSYVVFDAANAATFTNGTDSVIKVAGVTDLASGDFVLS